MWLHDFFRNQATGKAMQPHSPAIQELPKKLQLWTKALQPGRLEARLALTDAVKKQAYALRHDGYVAVGYVKPQESGILQDEYDDRESSRTIVIYRNGIAAASARISLLDPESKIPGSDEVPASRMFRKEVLQLLQNLEDQGRPARAVEVTKLTRNPDFEHDNDLISAIFQMVGYLILDFDADVVLNTARLNHMRFYERLGFHAIAQPRRHPGIVVELGLMACFRESYDKVRHAVPDMSQLSRKDETFARFVAGELVPVFPHSRTLVRVKPAKRHFFTVQQSGFVS